MARDRVKHKGRRESGRFFQFPHAVWNCPNFRLLSHLARSLLLDVAMQFNGKNNGDLVVTWSFLSERGWRSKSTIAKHIKELEYYGFIVCVQHGGINVAGKQRPNLYALTWLSIDKIGYSDGIAMGTDWKAGCIPGTWKAAKSPLFPKKQKRKNPKQLKGQKNEVHQMYWNRPI